MLNLKAVLEEKLKEVSLEFLEIEEERGEDWYVYDACGGNVDDAYHIGLQDGVLEGVYAYAKQLLNMLNSYDSEGDVE